MSRCEMIGEIGNRADLSREDKRLFCDADRVSQAGEVEHPDGHLTRKA
jgi:hypothetical protein